MLPNANISHVIVQFKCKEGRVSYQKSEVECGWCGKAVLDGGEVACRRCYEKLEHIAPVMRNALERMVSACQRYLEERPVGEFELYNPDNISPLAEARAALAAYEEENHGKV